MATFFKFPKYTFIGNFI